MFGPDNIFIHMTGMTDDGWKYAADAGAHVSLSVPIEMHMRHGTPPIQKALDLGMTTSLSTDVECTMTADFFTQMRSLITLQRMFANEKALGGAGISGADDNCMRRRSVTPPWAAPRG
jgi:5-methylthioadenosine/S-adenosylhomocysteine deaminase